MSVFFTLVFSDAEIFRKNIIDNFEATGLFCGEKWIGTVEDRIEATRYTRRRHRTGKTTLTNENTGGTR